MVYNQIVTWTAFAILAMFYWVSAILQRLIYISVSRQQGDIAQLCSKYQGGAYKDAHDVVVVVVVYRLKY